MAVSILDAPISGGVPSILDLLKARTWTERALCTEDRYIDLPWMDDVGEWGGRDPTSIAAMLAACGECPVRTACLQDALESRDLANLGSAGDGRYRRIREGDPDSGGFRGFEPSGTWGGSTMDERRRVTRQVVAAFEGDLSEGRFDEIRRTVVTALEDTFAERLADWQRKAADQPKSLRPRYQHVLDAAASEAG